MKKPHIARLRRIQQQIREHPETHRQDTYHTTCGTAHCVAGWARIHQGFPKITGLDAIAQAKNIEKSAAAYLQLTDTEADNLFFCGNTAERVDILIDLYCFPEYRKTCR